MYHTIMNLFKPTTFTWKEIALLKWSVLLIGIAIGAEWANIFSNYFLVLIIIGLILCIPPTIAWIKGH